MEKFVVFAIPALLGYILVRCLLYPMQWALKAGIHCLCGFTCLWLLNMVSGYTGILLPINAATVLISALFGVPGIGLIALLEMV